VRNHAIELFGHIPGVILTGGSSMWAEAAVEVLVVAGAFGRAETGWISHAGRRIPWFRQRFRREEWCW